MSIEVHQKRILAQLTPQFLVAEIKVIINIVEQYPNPNEIAVGDLTIAEFRKIQKTFHGSVKMMKEFCDTFVAKYIRGYIQRYPVRDPIALLFCTEENERLAAEWLVQYYTAERGQVPPEQIQNIDLIVDGIRARARQKMIRACLRQA